MLKIKDLQANLEPCKSFRMRSSKRVPEVRIIKGLRKRVSLPLILKKLLGIDARDELGQTNTSGSFTGPPPVTKAYCNGWINKDQGKVDDTGGF